MLLDFLIIIQTLKEIRLGSIKGAGIANTSTAVWLIL